MLPPKMVKLGSRICYEKNRSLEKVLCSIFNEFLFFSISGLGISILPASDYLFKVVNASNGTIFEICSKLTIKTLQ